MEGMDPSQDAAASDAARLREHGLRSTPQRRAILRAFNGGASEHLSADEVYARAVRSVPALGRGTVYAALAELTEAGLLAAIGSPEPVRYESNTGLHSHFRCRVCLRIFDIDLALENDSRIKQRGSRVERIDVQAQGVCGQCGDYARRLEAGARSVGRVGPPLQPWPAPGLAVRSFDSPLGPLTIAATDRGVARIAFAEHADASALLEAKRKAGASARRHLVRATDQLEGYFAGELRVPEAQLDLTLLGADAAAALTASNRVGYAETRSYSDLELDVTPRRAGEIFGSNPLPILTACHRVMRGIEVPSTYVGGSQRRRWLLEHEQQQVSGRGRPFG
jgi:methylated-DNA-[protein]-cysteine S-methyltransferase